jgi:hypothetical protein
MLSILQSNCIVTDLLRAKTVESQEAAVTRELHGKHVSVVTNTHTIEELREVVLPHGLVPGRQ